VRVFEKEKSLLPDFGRTPHLPWNPNGTADDLVATDGDLATLFSSPRVLVEEKVDGALVGFHSRNGDPIVRNRDHILSKAYLKNTPSKLQFRSVWGYFYEHRSQFRDLEERFGFPVSVYGEWLYATHTLHYTDLPSVFLPHTLYDPGYGVFVDALVAREALLECGFPCPQVVSTRMGTREEVEAWMGTPSTLGSQRMEGLYFKVSDGTRITHRFKKVSGEFHQDPQWFTRPLERNGIRKGK
jgi:atypical dual specificity phosphatase